MSAIKANVQSGTNVYQRHQPERTLLYQLVERHYPTFNHLMAQSEHPLPAYVRQEFAAYLKCGRLEHGFLRVQCGSCKHEDLVAFSCKKRGFCPSCGARRMVESAALLVDEILPPVPLRQWVLSVPFQLRFLFASYPEVMGKALGIVYRAIATHLIHTAGFSHDTARTGAITFIQRFGSALNLNVHFHMLFLDGVYISGHNPAKQVFRRVNAPTKDTLQALVQHISERLARFLTREGLLTADAENPTLTLEHLDANPLQHLQGHSITYRVAVGPQQGKKVFTLQTLPAQAAEEGDARFRRYELKTPYRDGTTHVFFEPLDFIAKLAALAPKALASLAGRALEKILSHLRSKAETQAMLLPPARAPPAVGLFEEGIQF